MLSLYVKKAGDLTAGTLFFAEAKHETKPHLLGGESGLIFSDAQGLLKSCPQGSPLAVLKEPYSNKDQPWAFCPKSLSFKAMDQC